MIELHTEILLYKVLYVDMLMKLSGVFPLTDPGTTSLQDAVQEMTLDGKVSLCKTLISHVNYKECRLVLYKSLLLKKTKIIPTWKNDQINIIYKCFEACNNKKKD